MIKYYIEGLNIQNIDSLDIVEVDTISYKEIETTGKIGNIIKKTVPLYNGELLHGQYLPLLIPLESINDEILSYLSSTYNIVFDRNYIESSLFDYEKLPFGLVQNLIDLQVDVFDLIANGEAIAIDAPNRNDLFLII